MSSDLETEGNERPMRSSIAGWRSWLTSLTRWDGLAFALVAVTSGIITSLPSPAGQAFFDLGPNDYRYLDGFIDYYEVAEETATRWTTYDATVELPVRVEGGPVELSFQFTRVYPETASVELYLDDQLVDVFECRGGELRREQVRVAAVPSTPATIRFVTDSHERENRGIRLDWIRIQTGERGRMSLAPSVRWHATLFASLLFVSFLYVGVGKKVSLLFSGGWILFAGLWLTKDPFGFAHFTLHALATASLLAVLAAGWLRRFAGGRWAFAIFMLGLLIKSAGLFHPTTFYPDVANARRYVMAYPESTAGTLAERGVETQKKMGVGYPRRVGGKDYAFPYSPLYFLSFGWVGNAGAVEHTVRLLGLSASVLLIPVVFWMGSKARDPALGIWAASLLVIIPPATSRLVLAHHATLLGNFLDGVLIAATLALCHRPKSIKHWSIVGASSQASLLAYVSSLFSVGSFLSMTALIQPKLRWRLLTILIATSLITVSWLYWPFTILFVTEILPAVLAGESANLPEASSPAALAGGLSQTLNRLLIFFGPVYGLLATVGLYLGRNRLDPRTYGWITGWALAFLVLLSLRAFGGGMFRDLKEITFVAPLVALLAGLSLSVLFRRGRAGAIAALVLVVGLFAFGLSKYRGYLTTYHSPLMTVVDD